MAQIEKVKEGIYRISGNIDFSTVMTLLTQFRNLSLREKNIVIDLQAVEKANSAGLGLLVELLGYAQKQGQIIRFSNIPESLMDLAVMSNVDQLLTAN